MTYPRIHADLLLWRTAEFDEASAPQYVRQSPTYGNFVDHSIMPEYKLTSEILERSVAQTWDEAKLEWRVQDINPQGEPSTCLCGHHPIFKLCTIANQKTGLLAIVGNRCVKKFPGLSADKICQAIKRIQKDPDRAVNAETIEYAYQKRWINKYERDFYLNTMRMRSGGKLTPKRLKFRREVNAKILKRWLAPGQFSS